MITEVINDNKSIITIGVQGEKDVRQFNFPITEWKNEVGEGQGQVLVKRNGDETPFLAVSETTPDFISWIVGAEATEKAGRGEIQILYYVGNKLAKSERYQMRVKKSLDNPDQNEAMKPWVDTVVDAANQATSEADRAKAEADRAEAAAESKIPIATTEVAGIVKPDGKTISVAEDGTISADIAAGPMGPAGPEGKPGKDGKDGLPGKDGKDGLPGPAGPEGPKGDKGADGAAGPKGDKGDTGAPGKDGVNGKDGLPGAKGDTGPAGKDGTNGKDGLPGKDGKDGAPGKDGAEGPMGPAGPKGDTGAPGEKGDQGLPGEAGPAGADGKDATINGVNTLNLIEGSNITLTQDGSNLTISASGGGGGSGGLDLSDRVYKIKKSSLAISSTTPNIEDRTLMGVDDSLFVNGNTFYQSGDKFGRVSNSIFVAKNIAKVSNSNRTDFDYCLIAGYGHQFGDCSNYVFTSGSNNVFKNGVNWGTAIGQDLRVYCNNQMVSGQYNIENSSNTYATITGNGDYAKRSNAYTLDWKGNGAFKGQVSSNGADYAEYFEWQDGNPEVEDRIGLIVALDGEKIRKANREDDVLGVISGTVGVLGDNYEWQWQGTYLTDEYGRVIYDMVEEFNEDGESLGKFPHPRLSPDFDNTKEYVKRADRPEWDAVGMMGKLFVRDDGTANVNDYVEAKDGVATKASGKTNMRVMKRVAPNIIRICLK